MTTNKRISLNIAATYGRSLYALAVGLVTARWALNSLGQVDYGLYGVVGGLTAFISYFNAILGSSVARFYAVSVGRENCQVSDAEVSGLEECRQWFTTAVVVHTAIPVVLMLGGYPLGSWAVENFLTIPAERVGACVWVWRFVCASCFVSMVALPFGAMYTAKQYIAELTIYSFATTTCNALFLYYMITHPGVWLARYAFWQCLLALLPQVVIAVRAVMLFPECRIRRRYLNCWANVKKLSGYALWNGWGALGGVLREQGDAVLINRYFGPVVNAGFAVGSTVSNHASALSASMVGAFSPAVFNLWGAGEYDRARALGYRVCKLGTLLVLAFALPLALEIDTLLLIWLRDPPEFAAGFCVFVLAMNVIDKLSDGQRIVVNAKGRIALYQILLGTLMVLTMPLAWLLIVCGCGVYSVGCAMVATMAFCSVGRVVLARGLVQMSFRHWAANILLPLLGVSFLAYMAGWGVRTCMERSFLRMVLVGIACEAVFLSLAWRFVLLAEERAHLLRRFGK